MSSNSTSTATASLASSSSSAPTSTAVDRSLSSTSTKATTDPGSGRSAPSPAVVIGFSVVGAVLVVIIAVLFVLIMRKRRAERGNWSQGDTSELESADGVGRVPSRSKPFIASQASHGLPDFPAPPLGDQKEEGLPRSFTRAELPDLVQRMHKDSGFAFEAEFEELEELSPSLPHDRSSLFAMAAENAAKNRFLDILPFDENRVHLCDDHQDPDDYINASYIAGINGEREYIASQGPIAASEEVAGRKVSTTGDFWRMIYRERVQNVVMLCQSLEQFRQRCSIYWPKVEGETETFGEFEVTLVEEDNGSEFVRRKLLLVSGEGEEIRVNQFHFEMWVDRSGAERSGVLALLEAVRARQSSQAPLLVHCSAGVGRTGTLIALDILLQSLPASDRLSVFNTVLQLRKQRVRTVQTQEQYVFLYDTLASLVGNLGQSYTPTTKPDPVPIDPL